MSLPKRVVGWRLRVALNAVYLNLIFDILILWHCSLKAVSAMGYFYIFNSLDSYRSSLRCMIPSTRGGNRLHSQLPSECDYLESSNLWQLLIDNRYNPSHQIRSRQSSKYWRAYERPFIRLQRQSLSLGYRINHNHKIVAECLSWTSETWRRCSYNLHN